MTKLSQFLMVAVLAVMGFMAGLVGCGGSASPVGSVQGKVLLTGVPLSTGSVLFYSTETGMSAGADLGSGGEFELSGSLPPGIYRVSVLPPTPEENGEPGFRAPAPTVIIPKQFSSESTTPLVVTVKPGANEIPLDIR